MKIYLHYRPGILLDKVGQGVLRVFDYTSDTQQLSIIQNIVLHLQNSIFGFILLVSTRSRMQEIVRFVIQNQKFSLGGTGGHPLWGFDAPLRGAFSTRQGGPK